MKVFKFGGASIKDSDSVKNLVENIRNFIGYELVVVVSAMGKTTNNLEKLAHDFFYEDGDITALLQPIIDFHNLIAEDLIPQKDHAVFNELNNIYTAIKNKSLKLRRAEASFDFLYDQIISEGEMMSSTVISHYLNEIGIYTKLLDARALIKTNNQYREAIVNWEETEKLFNEKIDFNDNCVYLTQGFIGSCEEGHSTTLGREGSDFTAAIFIASCP